MKLFKSAKWTLLMTIIFKFSLPIVCCSIKGWIHFWRKFLVVTRRPYIGDLASFHITVLLICCSIPAIP